MTPTFNRNPEDGSGSEPTLAEMARVALASLEKNPEGFFLVVEGSQIDWANHANHLEYQVKEIQAFDQAVATVQEWIAADPDRESETLVIVVPDHDCGGFAITGPQGHNVSGPGELVKGKWLGGGQHTAEDTLIWSSGPYSRFLSRAVDNTDLFKVMKSAMEGLPGDPLGRP